MNRMEFEKLEPKDLVEIEFPQILRVEKRLIEGDVDGKVMFEVTHEKGHLTQYEREILQRGGRVFHTENDVELAIHSEESLKFREQIQKTHTG